MSYKDVKRYYLEVERNYIDMVALSEEYLKAYKEGKFTEEQFNIIENNIKQIKSDYEKLSYIMFLFNQPKRKDKRKKWNKENELLSDTYIYLKADKEAVLQEETYVLEEFKKGISKLRETE